MHFLHTPLAGLATALLCLSPVLAGLDHGGVFLWTQWAMAWAACAALALAAVVMTSGPRQRGLRPFAVPLLLAAATVFLWFQTLPLPNWLGSWLADGSWDLYTRWLAPLQGHATDAGQLPADGRFAVSIAPWLSMTRWSLMAVVAGFALAASLAITTRRRVGWMMVAFAATGAVHAGVGIASLVITPGTTIWGQSGGAAFGAFINQNNACTLLVLGLACAVGILAWRLSALSGFLQDRDRLDAEAVKELFSDPQSLAAGILSAVCIAGLLTSGSRGGVAAPVFAVSILLAFFHFSIGRRGRSILAATAVGGLIAALVLVRFGLPLRSVDELNRSDEAWAQTVADDVRWDHWADALQAVRVHWMVGSGGGTYRYAYLPYQATSSSAWAVNADNTWLEWTVETGLVGVVLLATLLTVIARSLWSLGRSSDPLDFGLATAGTFALAALAFTQFFDFGLLLIPNATLAAVLFAVVAARAAAVPKRSQPEPKALASGTTRPAPAAAKNSPLAPRNSQLTPPLATRLSPIATLLLVTAFTIAAVPQLHAAATSEAYQRYGNMLTAAEVQDTQRMARLAERIRTHVASHPQDSQAAVRLCALQCIVARQRAAAATEPTQTGQSAQEITRLLHPTRLRTLWYQQPATEDQRLAPTRHSQLATRDSAKPPLLTTNDSPTDDPQTQTRAELGNQYSQARELAAQAIRYCPLSDEARYHLVRLDFAGGSPEQSRDLLIQLASLRRQHLPTLSRVAGLAQAGEMWELTRDIWRRILTLNPGMTPRGLAAIGRSGPLTASDIVPATPAALTLAARVELRAEKPDTRLLATAEEVLAAQAHGPRADQVARLQLLGQIATKRHHHPAAAAYYQKALALDPQNSAIRKALANAKAAIP